MNLGVQRREGADYMRSPFGLLALEPGLYDRRTVSATEFGESVSARHTQAWQDGRDGFVYGEVEALQDGVV